MSSGVGPKATDQSENVARATFDQAVGKRLANQKMAKVALIAGGVIALIGVIIAIRGGVVGNEMTTGFGLGWLTLGGVGAGVGALAMRYLKPKHVPQEGVKND